MSWKDSHFRAHLPSVLLDIEEEHRLIASWKAGDKRAGERLMLYNMRGVIEIASRYFNHKTSEQDREDMIQQGMLGLRRALDKFDPSNNIRFFSYAGWWVRAYVVDYISENSRLLYVPQNARDLIVMGIRWLEYSHPEITSRDDKIAMIAKRFGKPVERIREAWEALNATAFELDRPFTDGDDELMVEFLRSDESPPDEICEKTELSEVVREVLSKLPPRERDVIQRRYLNRQQQTLQEVGDEYQFSRERARQLENRGLRRIKGHLSAKPDFEEIAESAGCKKPQRVGPLKLTTHALTSLAFEKLEQEESYADNPEALVEFLKEQTGADPEKIPTAVAAALKRWLNVT